MRDKEFFNDNNTLRCKVKNNNDIPWWEQIKDDTKNEQRGAKPKIEYNAGPSQHIFKWKGKNIWFSQHEKGKAIKTGHDRKLTNNENITITTYGTDTTILKDFIDAAVVHSMEKDEGKIGIYEQHRWGIGWMKAQVKKARGIESVVLD